MKGFEEWTQADVDRINAQRGGKHMAHAEIPPEVEAPKKSKYRNVKVVVGLRTFDSMREADYWLLLEARQAAGEIEHLQHHEKFPLLAPNRVHGNDVIVAYYEADYSYTDCGTGTKHVVDAKGVRTQMYKLKKKWLELQDGISIEEV